MGTIAGRPALQGQQERSPAPSHSLQFLLLRQISPTPFHQAILRFNNPLVLLLLVSSGTIPLPFVIGLAQKRIYLFVYPPRQNRKEANRGTDEQEYIWDNQEENSNANLAE